MFYSASTRGFYSEEMHGARTLLVADPAWVRPLIDVTLAPGEVFDLGNGEALVNKGKKTATFAGIPDPAALPSMVEVENPDCRIPADAVEISREQHAALLEGQSLGKVIAPDAYGAPLLSDPPPPTDEALAAAARAERTARLAACDWAVLPDAPLSESARAAWVAYRQALRDLTAQEGFPSDIAWPEKP